VEEMDVLKINDDDDEDNNLLESTGTCRRRADVLK
jgi:hypothetical protein